MMGLHWREPLWLLLSFYPLLLAIWQHIYQRYHAQKYADPALLPWVVAGSSHWKMYIRSVLWLCFWILLAISLAGPRTALQNPNDQSSARQDIVVLVDVSRSMRTSDIAPSRLQRASLELYELLQFTQNSRLAVIVYAAHPHILVPFTVDTSAVKFYLQYLDSLVLPSRGSQAATALDFALKTIHNRSDSHRPAAIVWLTDGDIPQSQQAVLKKQAQQLHDAGIPLAILGIGTEDGDAIPLVDGSWLKHKGQVVRSRLNSGFLQTLAKQAKGSYSTVKDDNSDWQTLYVEGVAQILSLANPQDKPSQQWRSFALWGLVPAMFLLFFLSALPRTILPVFLLFYLPVPQPVFADSLVFDQGVRAYREKNYQQAIKQFSSAVFQAKTDEERARALHNLGNSYFNQGDYRAAIQVFEDALRYRPKYRATLQNLSLGQAVQVELEKRLAARANKTADSATSGGNVERWSNELDWDQQTTRTWGESKAQPIENIVPIPLDDASLDKLVNRGFQRLAEHGAKNLQEWNRRQQSLADAQVALQQMDTNPATLFKRLFEIEEGYYSKQSEPQRIPEVLPW